MEVQITKTGALDMQICVPKYWDDKQIKELSEQKNPCGTQNGWQIRKQGDKSLLGANERVSCSVKKNFVHIMLDA